MLLYFVASGSRLLQKRRLRAEGLDACQRRCHQGRAPPMTIEATSPAPDLHAGQRGVLNLPFRAWSVPETSPQKPLIFFTL